MAHKRLSLQDVEQMKIMVQKGVAPEDIARHFQVAISSVHNYKAKFKQQGLQFPSVRGKRPTGSVDVKSSTPVKQTADVQTIPIASSDAGGMNFVVNGVNVQVSAEAKNVNITKGSIEINF